MTGDFEVGYARPPKHTQFKPGQSGNPKGRPKRAKNLKTLLREEAEAPVRISEGGKSRTVTKQQALIKRLMTKALGGDLKAAQLLLGYFQTYLDPGDEAGAMPALSADDLAVLDNHAAFLEAKEALDHDDPAA